MELSSGRSRLAESVPGFLSLGCGGCDIVRAIDAEGAIPERDVKELTVMGLVRLRMRVRTEMLAGDTHARNGNLSLQLQRANELHQGGQETDLLLLRKVLLLSLKKLVEQLVISHNLNKLRERNNG
jgi:hypothetical protein